MLADRLAAIANDCRIALALPTLQLPPVFMTPHPAADPLALRLKAAEAACAARYASNQRIVVLDAEALELQSPLRARRDVAREIAYDLPYTPEHSAELTSSLAAWNVAADAVAFVDDSPFELGQARSRHPSLACLQFPREPAGVLKLCRELRDRCGRPAASAEDRLRRDGLIAQSRAEAERVAAGTTMEEFLTGLRARTTISIGPQHVMRAFDLVNKTNQFNINGHRTDEVSWQRQLEREDTCLVTASYEDRSGPLGVVAALLAAPQDDAVHVSTWVLSCRAFSRHIEYRLLHTLFERFDSRTVFVHYDATARNAPVREFLAKFAAVDGSGPVRVERQHFAASCSPLYDEVVIDVRGTRPAT